MVEKFWFTDLQKLIDKIINFFFKLSRFVQKNLARRLHTNVF